LTDLVFTELDNLAKDIEFAIPDGTVEGLLGQLRDIINSKLPGNAASAASTSAMSLSSDANRASSTVFSNIVYAMFNQSTAKEVSNLLQIHITTEMINKVLGLIPP